MAFAVLPLNIGLFQLCRKKALGRTPGAFTLAPFDSALGRHWQEQLNCVDGRRPDRQLEGSTTFRGTRMCINSRVTVHVDSAGTVLLFTPRRACVAPVGTEDPVDVQPGSCDQITATTG
jgi:hypothetical protein